MATKQYGLDSRTSSILINLNLNLNTGFVANQYGDSAAKIEESSKGDAKKTYNSLRSALRESYLTGSLRYGKGFVS
ncbi:MAG: hypothetical protein IKU37_07575 [Candidatus Gastranaerophilales bacterium]|nr:hypothetical protein [Candidatus Gastranaerophilales bacterium]